MMIGDLGDVPVNLPNHIVRLVEYDGDPSWGEKRVGISLKELINPKLIVFILTIVAPPL
ncbi:hypothetical protein ACX1NY_09585 [Acinetobacter sp. ANC 4631]